MLDSQQVREVGIILSQLKLIDIEDVRDKLDDLSYEIRSLDEDQVNSLFEHLEDEADDEFLSEVKECVANLRRCRNNETQPENTRRGVTDAFSSGVESGTRSGKKLTSKPDTADFGQYKVHPVAALFPLIEGEAFDELVRDIREYGMHDPIVLNGSGDTIIDGRNRYRACIEAGVEPKFINLAIGESEVAYIISKNLQRRHLKTSERAMLAAQTLDHLEEEAEQRKLANLNRGKSRGGKFATSGKLSATQKEVEFGKSRDQAAKLAGVSPRLVSDAKVILDKSPAVAAEVAKGKITVNAGLQQVKERKKPEINFTKKIVRDQQKAVEQQIIDQARANKETIRRLEMEIALVCSYLRCSWGDLLAEARVKQ